MANEVHLLKMLEPAVRPGNLPAPSRPLHVPIESQSFEALLEQVQEAGDSEAGRPTPKSPAPDPDRQLLGQLGQVDRIDNGSLRRQMSGPSRASAAPQRG